MCIVYSGYEKAFDEAGSWISCNNFTRNVVVFGVTNSSLSHTDHGKKCQVTDLMMILRKYL